MNVKERVTVGFCFDHHAPKFASLHAFLFSIFIETFCIWHQDHRQKKRDVGRWQKCSFLCIITNILYYSFSFFFVSLYREFLVRGKMRVFKLQSCTCACARV